MQWQKSKTKHNCSTIKANLVAFYCTFLSNACFLCILNDFTLQQASLNRWTFKLINNQGHFYKVKETVTMLCIIGILIIQHKNKLRCNSNWSVPRNPAHLHNNETRHSTIERMLKRTDEDMSCKLWIHDRKLKACSTPNIKSTSDKVKLE